MVIEESTVEASKIPECMVIRSEANVGPFRVVVDNRKVHGMTVLMIDAGERRCAG
jgi:hypothetical protein